MAGWLRLSRYGASTYHILFIIAFLTEPTFEFGRT